MDRYLKNKVPVFKYLNTYLYIVLIQYRNCNCNYLCTFLKTVLWEMVPSLPLLERRAAEK